MTDARARILIVGAGSRIAHALQRRLGTAIRGVGRHDGEIRVHDYEAIPAVAFDGIETVINCVGVSTGPTELLRRLNVDVPTGIAAAAKHAGAARMIHVSSFSVHGAASRIANDTPFAPTGVYGKTKLAAELALAAIDDDRFAISRLRLPLIYAHESPGKLGQLMRTWTRLGVWPVPPGDVRRSMISVELAAQVIEGLVDTFRSGPTFAADPMPFGYARSARARSEKLRTVTVPRPICAAAVRLAPAIGNRLFADCFLSPDDNLAIELGIESQLYRDIAALDLR